MIFRRWQLPCKCSTRNEVQSINAWLIGAILSHKLPTNMREFSAVYRMTNQRMCLRPVTSRGVSGSFAQSNRVEISASNQSMISQQSGNPSQLQSKKSSKRKISTDQSTNQPTKNQSDRPPTKNIRDISLNLANQSQISGHLANQSITWSNRQSSDQSIDRQPIGSINPSIIHQSINQWNHKQINQSINQWINQPIN